MENYQRRIIIEEGNSEIIIRLEKGIGIAYYDMIFKYTSVNTIQFELALSIYAITTIYTSLHRFFTDEDLSGYYFMVSSLPNINSEYYKIAFSSEPFSDWMEIEVIKYNKFDIVSNTHIEITLDELRDLYEVMKECIFKYNPN